jgi:hypothetical protein
MRGYAAARNPSAPEEIEEGSVRSVGGESDERQVLVQ